MSKLLKVFLIASFAIASFSAKAVTVASWGGAYTESQQKAYADTYTDPSSIQFENYNGGLGEVRAQVESGSVTWDLVDALPGDAITGCDEGLFEDITTEIADLSTPGPDGESMLEDMENNGLEYHSGWDCCVPQIFWTYVVFYDPDAFPGDKPSSMADFFDVEKFPGKRGIHTWATGIVEKAMVADGVKPSAVPTVLEIAKQNKIPLMVVADKYHGEITTPTGIALIATFLDKFGQPEKINIKKIGIGLGSKKISRPNFLRILLVDENDNYIANNNQPIYETIISQEAWIDDSTPEDIAILIERLRAAGAIDVICHSVDMK